jgi:uncharacterized protein (DUF427 family)
MPNAIWNNQVIADAPFSEVHRVGRNACFPLSVVKREYFYPIKRHTSCVRKGIASYYEVVVDGMMNDNATWYYPEPSGIAASIKDQVAFRHGAKEE